MSREGKIEEGKRKREVIRVKCSNIELFVVGAGRRMIEEFESYAIANIPVPIEISMIKKIQKVNLKDDFFEELEVVFENKE